MAALRDFNDAAAAAPPRSRSKMPPVFGKSVSEDSQSVSEDSQTFRTRGRPRGSADLHLSDNILLAAERLMAGRNSTDLLLREVAEEAGTSISMIYYYFGSLNGLLFCLVDKRVQHILATLREVEQTFAQIGEGFSAYLVTKLEEAFRANEVSIRLVTAEGLKRESSLWKSYFEKHRWAATSIIERMFRGLQQRGVFDASVDPRVAATMILCIIGAPTIYGPVIPLEPAVAGVRSDAQWLRHAALLLDRLFLAPAEGEQAAQG